MSSTSFLIDHKLWLQKLLTFNFNEWPHQKTLPYSGCWIIHKSVKTNQALCSTSTRPHILSFWGKTYFCVKLLPKLNLRPLQCLINLCAKRCTLQTRSSRNRNNFIWKDCICRYTPERVYWQILSLGTLLVDILLLDRDVPENICTIGVAYWQCVRFISLLSS